LIKLERDFESKKHGYSAKSYLKILDEALPTIYEDGMIFVHDNAPIHSATKTKEWLDEWLIEVSDWPPYSPDLNPIENAWAKLKERLHDFNPDLELTKGGEEKVRQVIFKGLEEAWDALGSEYVRGLIESMPRRCAAVIEAKGWYTKY
jgi:transposase